MASQSCVQLPEIDGETNVLVAAPFGACETADICSSLLAADPPEQENVLFVTLTDAPEDATSYWERLVDLPSPNDVRVIHAGTSADDALSSSTVVIPNPGNLTQYGVAITDQLREWDGNGKQTVFCHRSLSELLQYTDLAQAFKFLHSLRSRVQSYDVVAHYHVDPTVHSPEELNTLKRLMDVYVEIDPDDGVTVTSR